MKRGVVQLTTETREKLLQLDNTKWPETLKTKIQSLSETVFYLELSQEEVEVLLDQLPGPNQQDAVSGLLRYQLSQVLT